MFAQRQHRLLSECISVISSVWTVLNILPLQRARHLSNSRHSYKTHKLKIAIGFSHVSLPKMISQRTCSDEPQHAWFSLIRTGKYTYLWQAGRGKGERDAWVTGFYSPVGKEAHSLQVSIPDTSAPAAVYQLKPMAAGWGRLPQENSLEVTPKPWAERVTKGIPDLLRSSSRCGIGDGPGCLFPCTELCFLKNFNQHGEDVCIYDSLREDWGGVGRKKKKASHFKERNEIRPTNQLTFTHVPFLEVLLCSCYIAERLQGNLASATQNL